MCRQYRFNRIAATKGQLEHSFVPVDLISVCQWKDVWRASALIQSSFQRKYKRTKDSSLPRWVRFLTGSRTSRSGVHTWVFLEQKTQINVSALFLCGRGRATNCLLNFWVPSSIWSQKSYLVDPASTICLFKGLSHACLSINIFIQWNCVQLIISAIIYLKVTLYTDNCRNSRANTCVQRRLSGRRVLVRYKINAGSAWFIGDS